MSMGTCIDSVQIYAEKHVLLNLMFDSVLFCNIKCIILGRYM